MLISKVKMIFSFMVLILFVSASNNFTQDHHSKMHSDTSKMHGKHQHKMMTIMNDMHKDMEQMEMSGNPDKDFATMMIRHHKGAIDMSERELSEGKDQKLKEIAQNTIDKQTKDIEELKKFSDENTAMNKQTNMKKEETENEQMVGGKKHMMTGSMKDMKKDMNNMELSGDADKDFAEMMIMHHQAAVKMSEEYLDEGNKQELKTLAQKMIDDNKMDIEKLKEWKKNKK